VNDEQARGQNRGRGCARLRQTLFVCGGRNHVPQNPLRKVWSLESGVWSQLVKNSFLFLAFDSRLQTPDSLITVLSAYFSPSSNMGGSTSKTILKVVPRPSSLVTSMRPPCWRTMSCVTQSPSPVPFFLVEK